jgi:hypothetical protein
MITALYLIALCLSAGVVVLGLYLVLRPVAGAYLKFRGTRLITCPETKAPAAVEVDAKHAAATAFLGQPALRLQDCSRWPERRDCDQACLKQIEAAPADCLVRTILTRWYEGKVCVLCRKPFGDIAWSLHKPALMNAERQTVEWHEVRPEQVPQVLATHLPVCWDCHIVETFRRLHPELVVERPWPGTELRSR